MKIEEINEPKLNKENLHDRELVGKCLLSFIKNDPFCKELTSPFLQEWAEKGLLESFCRIYFKNEPKTTILVPWFMDRVASDLLNTKDFSKEQFRNFLDMLSRYDANSLEQVFTFVTKYNIDPNDLRNDFRKSLVKITDDEDKSMFLLAFFSDAIFHSEIIIVSYYYEQWFGEDYETGVSRLTEFIWKTKV